MEISNPHDNPNHSISEFNIYELRGWIIDRTYQLETRIDNTICGFYEPKRKKEFQKVILNSSIISLGAKTKILSNINGFDKKVIEKLKRIISIRNAFAHLPTNEHIELKGKKNDKEQSTIIDITQSLKIEIMNSSGQIKTKDLAELRSEFYDLNKQIREYFIELNLNK